MQRRRRNKVKKLKILLLRRTCACRGATNEKQQPAKYSHLSKISLGKKRICCRRFAMLLLSSFERNSCRKLKSKAFFSSFKLLLEKEQQENWRVNFHVCHHETISLTLRCFLFDRIIHDFQFFKTPILIICNYLGKLRRHILVSMVWWWFLVCYLFGYLFYLWTVLLIYLATSDYQKTHVILVLTEMMMGVNFVQASVDFSGLILQTTMCAALATNHLERRLSQSWVPQK